MKVHVQVCVWTIYAEMQRGRYINPSSLQNPEKEPVMANGLSIERSLQNSYREYSQNNANNSRSLTIDVLSTISRAFIIHAVRISTGVEWGSRKSTLSPKNLKARQEPRDRFQF